MATIYVDTAMRFHRKIRKLDAAEAWYFVSAIAHSHAGALDGFIDPNDLDAIVLRGHRGGHSSDEIVAKLVSVGLFDVVEGGWRVHDYLAYQQSAADIERNRLAGRSRARRSYQNRRDSSGEENGEERPDSSGVSSDQKKKKKKKKISSEAEEGQIVSIPSESTPACAGGTSQLPEAAPEKPRRKIDPAKLQPSQIVWNFYADLFYVSCGARPDPQDRHFVQINRLLKNHAPDGIAARLKNYFESPPWVCREGSRDFDRFVKFFDQLAVPATETAQETVDRVLVKSRERAAQIGTNGIHQPLLRAES